MTHYNDVRNQGNSNADEQNSHRRPTQHFGCELEYDHICNVRLHAVQFNGGDMTLDPGARHCPFFISDLHDLCQHAFQAELRTWNLVVALDDQARRDLCKIFSFFTAEAWRSRSGQQHGDIPYHSPAITTMICTMVEKTLLAFADGNRIAIPDDGNWREIYGIIVRHPILNMPSAISWESSSTTIANHGASEIQPEADVAETQVERPWPPVRERIVDLNAASDSSSDPPLEDARDESDHPPQSISMDREAH